MLLHANYVFLFVLPAFLFTFSLTHEPIFHVISISKLDFIFFCFSSVGVFSLTAKAQAQAQATICNQLN